MVVVTVNTWKLQHDEDSCIVETVQRNVWGESSE